MDESVSGTFIGSKLEANWKLKPSANCKNVDTTANNKNLNGNETESSVSVAPTKPDLVAEALKHIEDMKRRRSRISR